MTTATPAPLSPPGVIQEVAWGQDPVDQYRKLRFSLRANQKARIAVLDTTTYKSFVHFGRTYVYCLGDGCPFCAVKPPSPRYLTWILVYNVDANGTVIKPYGGVVKALLFGRDKYSVLSGLAEEYTDLRTLDLIVECSEEKYQRFTITPARECLWQKDTEFAKSVINMLKETKVDATSLIARTVSLEQMKGIVAGKPDEVAAPDLAPDTEAIADLAGASTSNETLKTLLDQLSSKG